MTVWSLALPVLRTRAPAAPPFRHSVRGLKRLEDIGHLIVSDSVTLLPFCLLCCSQLCSSQLAILCRFLPPMYYCSRCHVPIGPASAWQYWFCLGTRPYWHNPPGVWYYPDRLGNLWVVRCHACFVADRLADLHLDQEDT